MWHVWGRRGGYRVLGWSEFCVAIVAAFVYLINEYE
jgi:hypothetical protein